MRMHVISAYAYERKKYILLLLGGQYDFIHAWPSSFLSIFFFSSGDSYNTEALGEREIIISILYQLFSDFLSIFIYFFTIILTTESSCFWVFSAHICVIPSLSVLTKSLNFWISVFATILFLLIHSDFLSEFSFFFWDFVFVEISVRH